MMLSEDDFSYDLEIFETLNLAVEVIGGTGEWTIRPFDAFFNRAYKFYMKVHARGGKNAFDNI